MSAAGSTPTRRRHRGYAVACIVLAALLVVAIVIAYRVTRPPSFEPLPVPSVSIA